MDQDGASVPGAISTSGETTFSVGENSAKTVREQVVTAMKEYQTPWRNPRCPSAAGSVTAGYPKKETWLRGSELLQYTVRYYSNKSQKIPIRTRTNFIRPLKNYPQERPIDTSKTSTSQGGTTSPQQGPEVLSTTLVYILWMQRIPPQSWRIALPVTCPDGSLSHPHEATSTDSSCTISIL